METPAKKASGPSNKVVITVAALAVAASLGVAGFALARKPADPGTIGYAAEAKVVLDQDALQAAADEAQKNARDGRVALRYKNNAYSKDGKTFTGLIVNAQGNIYDMFLTIYADAEMTDQIFLSGLVPPGSGFEEITLDHALEKGDHTVYVAVTQVDTNEDGIQVLKNQVVHTMEFHVE